MRRGLVAAALVVVAASCDNGGGESTTVVSAPTPTTVAAAEVCYDLADGAIDLVTDLVEVLDETRYEVLVDRSQWTEDLISIEERGAALQAEAVAGGCDPGAIQGAVAAAAADMEAGSGIARLLLELISP